MTRLRFVIILLALWEIVLFNIERYDVLGINVPTVLYVASSIAIIMTIIVPDVIIVRWYLLVIPSLLIYGVGRFPSLLEANIDAPIPAVTAEMAILSIAFLIGLWLSNLITQIERTYDSLVIDPKNSRILSGADGEDAFSRELFRARQYERPVSVLVIKTPTLKQLQRKFPTYLTYQVTLQHRFLKARIAQLAETLLYTTDPIAWYGDDIVICLPETNYERAFQLAQRIATIVRVSLQISAPIGISELSKQIMLFQDLVDEAEANLNHFEPAPKDEDDDIKTDPGKPVTLSDTQPLPLLQLDDQVTQPIELTPDDLPPKGLFATVRRFVQDNVEKIRLYVVQDPHILPPQEFEIDVPVNAKRYYNPKFWVNQMPYQTESSRAFYGYIKRVMDVTLILMASPLILPIFGIVGLLIKLEDGGPIFYSQPRTGHGAHEFQMYKFRSMIPNADKRLKELGVRVNERKETVDEHGNKLKHDPRVTRIGRILRKTSIDELPQLWNIFVGDMSLVGPRPTTFGVDKYTLPHTQRLSVKPGLTGLWQIYDRGDTDFDNRLIWDIKYIDKMCLALDIQILFRTFWEQVLKRRGA